MMITPTRYAQARKKLVIEERRLLIERLALNKRLRAIHSEMNSLDNVLVNGT